MAAQWATAKVRLWAWAMARSRGCECILPVHMSTSLEMPSALADLCFTPVRGRLIQTALTKEKE